MNRKTILLLLSVLAVMVVGIGVAVKFLYSGFQDNETVSSSVSDRNGLKLLAAVPADAIAVRCISDARDAADDPFVMKEIMSVAGSSGVVVSYHHAKKLVPLYVIDAGRSSDVPSESAAADLDRVKAAGLHAEFVADVAGRSAIVASVQENLVKSSLRHLEKDVCVMDARGFADAVARIDTEDVLFISNEHFRRLIDAAMTRKYGRYSAFFSRFADWIVLDTGGDRLKGAAVYEKGRADFMSVLENMAPGISSVSSVLPSHTLFAVSIPLTDVRKYLEGYEAFVDSRQELASYKAVLKNLSSVTGCSVEKFASGISEIAHAVFKVKGKVEQVNVVMLDKDALKALYPEVAAKGYKPAVHEYPFNEYLGSLFGKLFQLDDESCYTCIDNWIVSGSEAAVEEFVSGGALEYTLHDQMKDAGKDDLMSRTSVSSVAYLSLTEDRDHLKNVFSTKFLSQLEPLVQPYDYCPVIVSTYQERKNKGTFISVELAGGTVRRTKAPVTERDTTVNIPSGPFQVKNSGTGKMNEFYQNSHLSLCLRQEGKDLWGIPFKEKLCGRAQTIDYFANGKLQILFGAGSKVYLIDRLGRFVNGFPVELGKKILLGPDVYDFNGINKYNMMVLHDDRTIEMYNLKGQKPESWKGVRLQETVKNLPERIVVGGKSFWVVRTSIQTLIFPFTGGEPLTVFEGDKMIRPDSEVSIVDITSVEVESYDGRRRTVRLK